MCRGGHVGGVCQKGYEGSCVSHTGPQTSPSSTPPSTHPPHPFPPSRYDYEECDSGAAAKMVTHIKEVIANSPPGTKFGAFTLKEVRFRNGGAPHAAAGTRAAIRLQ